MDDRDALLAAIRAQPDEDTPRLAFADYLDEHGSPHWAGLIRAECERERLRADGSAAEGLIRFLGHIEDQGGCGKIAARVRWDRADPDVGRRLALEKQATKLRSRTARVRNAGRPTYAKSGLYWGKGTHRGFPAAAWVLAGWQFGKHFEAVARWCPPVELTIRHATDVPPDLVGRGLLAWTRALTLEYDPPGLVEAMSAHPDASGVRELSWRATGENVAAFAASVAGSPHWSGLRALECPEDTVPHDSAAALFAAEHLAELRTLSLVSVGWTAETVEGLVRGPMRNLRELALRFGSLDDDAAERLAAAPGLANLRYLDLSHNRITGRGVSALLSSRTLKNLAVLELERNPVRDLDRAALAAAPHGGLRAISFHGCQLQTDDITALASCPRLAELVYLDLDHNALTNAAVARLVADLPRAPAVVYLMGNEIATRGARALADWVGTPGIDQLHVCQNPLTAAGAAALATSPHLAGLRHLCVTGVTGAGRKELERRFGKRVEFRG